MLIGFFRYLRYRRAIRAEALSLFFSNSSHRRAFVQELASDPAASEHQRWFSDAVIRYANRLELDVKALDTATRYIEVNRLRSEYLALNVEYDRAAPGGRPGC